MVKFHRKWANLIKIFKQMFVLGYEHTQNSLTFTFLVKSLRCYIFVIKSNFFKNHDIGTEKRNCNKVNNEFLRGN